MSSTSSSNSSPGECLSSQLALTDTTSFYFYTSLGFLLLVAYLLNDKFHFVYHAGLWVEYLTTSVPTMDIPMTDAEAKDDGVNSEPCTTMELVDKTNPNLLNCYDPSTKQLLGQAKNMSQEEVHELLVKAKKAQEEWKNTTFAQRRMVLRTIQKYICQHVEDICRVSARESGKPKVDAIVGEIITSCEKIRTICEWGEFWLRPEYRPTGPMMMHKSAWLEFVPLGVIAPIAPWNYPFHNSVRTGIFSYNTIALCGVWWNEKRRLWCLEVAISHVFVCLYPLFIYLF